MKGAPEIIEMLNESLEGELYAIMQYILHSESCEDLGYEKLAEIIKKDAMQEMHHAEILIERILFLEGTPKLKMSRDMSWEADIRLNFKAQLAAEMDGLKIYRNGVKLSQKLEDTGTRTLIEGIVKDEEDHVDWIEAQLGMIEQVGVENYLAQQIYDDEK
jgi:bacterioferritin